MKKMYYAEYSQFGANVSYESLGGSAYNFYAFPSKAARDAWVDAHEYDGCNIVSATTTRKTVEHCLGKHFGLVDAGDMFICCRQGDENFVANELCTPYNE